MLDAREEVSKVRMLPEDLQARRQHARYPAAYGERFRTHHILRLVSNKHCLRVDDPLRRSEGNLSGRSHRLLRGITARRHKCKFRFTFPGFRRRLLRDSNSGKGECQLKSDKGGSRMCLHARQACKPYALGAGWLEKLLEPSDLCIEPPAELAIAWPLVDEAKLHVEPTRARQARIRPTDKPIAP